jgi:hypothetical protein
MHTSVMHIFASQEGRGDADDGVEMSMLVFVHRGGCFAFSALDITTYDGFGYVHHITYLSNDTAGFGLLHSRYKRLGAGLA